MFDYYFCSSDKTALSSFCMGFVNVIGPMQGREFVPSVTDDYGNIMPEIPAAGNPALWYAGIRTNGEVTPSSQIFVCDTEIARSALGLWA